MAITEFPRLSREFFGKCRCVQGRSPVKHVTVHETQGDTARGGAVTLTSRTDGSAHEVIDYREGYKLAEDDTILCHVGGQNTGNYGIEKAGRSLMVKRLRLLVPGERREIAFTAKRVAFKLRKHGLPCRYLPIEVLQRSSSITGAPEGWAYHRDLSLAYGTSTHTDPGIPKTHWPHRRFSLLVRFYYKFPKVNHPVTPQAAERALREAHE